MKRWIADAAGAGRRHRYGAVLRGDADHRECAGRDRPHIPAEDAILWPLMLLSLAVALWGFWQGRAQHRNSGPLVLGTIAAVSIACGVIVVHGPPAMQMIYGGALALVVATLWNVRARKFVSTSSVVT